MHALEANWLRSANPGGDQLAASASRRVLVARPLCPHAPDVRLRVELFRAALQAGLVFSQTRTVLAHALAHSVTLGQGAPNGHMCAHSLPEVWRLAVVRACPQ